METAAGNSNKHRAIHGVPVPRGAGRGLPAHSRKCYNVQTGKGNGTLGKAGNKGTREQGDRKCWERQFLSQLGERTGENRDDIEFFLYPALVSLP
jgi:hypothetical protein